MGNRYSEIVNFKYSGIRSLGFSDSTDLDYVNLKNFKIADFKESKYPWNNRIQKSDMRGFGYSYLQGLGYLDLRDNGDSFNIDCVESETGFFDGIMEKSQQNIMDDIRSILEDNMKRKTSMKIAW